MPEEVANSFNDEQLTHLLTAVGSRSWGKHKIDRKSWVIEFFSNGLHKGYKLTAINSRC